MDLHGTNKLIEQLDPKRDYGSYSHEELVAKINEGEVHLSSGHYRPVIRDKHGVVIRGSDSPLRSGVKFSEWFSALGDHYFEDVMQGLVNAAIDGDTKAAVWLLDKWTNSQPYEAESTDDLMARIVGRG
jgi:hypothetical protein